MEINVFLSMLLYIAAIVLVIVFIIVGIKLIGILDKADKVIDNLDEKVLQQYRKDFGKIEMQDMRFNKEDKKNYLRKISVAKPRYSKNISRRDKRFLKRMQRKKNIIY